MDVTGRRSGAGTCGGTSGQVVRRRTTAGPTVLLALACACCAALPAPARAQSAGTPLSPEATSVPAATGSVVARLDRASVAVGETVSLTVIATGVKGQVDTRALEQVFDIVGRSRSTRTDLINGVRRDRASWVLELSARRIGLFTVPPVTVGGVTSDLQTLEVTEAPEGGERELFVEARVDETSPWVQGQVVLTLEVFQAIEFIDASLGEPQADGLRVQRLGEDRRRSETRDGRTYEVTERRYALFAQRSGPLRIEPIALDATVPVDPGRARGFFTPSRRVLRTSKPIELQVRGRPPGSAGWWFPARDVSLSAAWSGTDPALAVPAGSDAATRVGVPVTRTLTLRALGAMPTQLPGIEAPTVTGASLYDEAPAVSEGASEEGVLTEQRIAWAVVPTEPGTLELPATSVAWFDTAAGRTRTATIAATRLHVAPAAGVGTRSPATTALVPADRGGDGAGAGSAVTALAAGARPDGSIAAYWRWLALAAVLGWALTAAAWWRGRVVRDERRTGAGEVRTGLDGARALQRVRSAVERGDSCAGLAQAVLAWAHAHWPEAPPASLPMLARRLAGSPAAETLLALDAALYARTAGGPVPPGTERLADNLEAATGPADRTRTGGGADGALPDL